MELRCMLAVVNRQGGFIEGLSRRSITATSMNNKSTSSEEPSIIVRTLLDYKSSDTAFMAKYSLIGNIDDLLIPFLNQGRATVCLKEQSYNIYITKADPDELTTFIVYLKTLLPKNSPVYISMAAFKQPLRQLYFDCQEKYKLGMENIIGVDINLDHVLDLEISNCTLKLAGDQVPIAGAIRKMKNLTTLQLGRIELRSSTFLEIESKVLRRLHLCLCRNQHLISSLFQNDLCYKDSLIELRLDGNRWSEIPNGVFQFQNLLELSLRINNITDLPDKITNLSKLQELELSHNQLRHLPPSIFEMQNLLKLSLSNNHISELPNMFANLSKLQVLSLSYNQLSHLPHGIFELQNLSKLLLSNNFITELPDTINLSKLNALVLRGNRLRHIPPSIFELQNLQHLSLSGNFITELPDKFTNLSKLKVLSLSRNQLQYLPPSILSLHLETLDVESNAFNFENVPPSVGSEVIVHSLKELSYRAILNHKLKVEEGMLPKKCLKDLENHHQCVCGCKYVDEGQEFLFSCNLNDIFRFPCDYRYYYLRYPIRGKMCTSLQSCFLDRFSNCK